MPPFKDAPIEGHANLVRFHSLFCLGVALAASIVRRYKTTCLARSRSFDTLRSIPIGDGTSLGYKQAAQQPQLATDALPEAARGHTMNLLAQHAQQ